MKIMEILNKIDKFFKRYHLDVVYKLCLIFMFIYGYYAKDIFDLFFSGILILFSRISVFSDCGYYSLYVEEEDGD